MKERDGEGRGRENPVPEQMPVGLMLAFVGGFLDAYTYLLHDGIFANAQTGNLVLLGIHMAQRNWGQAAGYSIPIGAFALGVLTTEGIDKKVHRVGDLRWRQMTVLTECAILLLVGTGIFGRGSQVVCCLIAFVCAMQVSAFKKIRGSNFATTMCTGNLRSATECMARYLMAGERREGGRCLTYLLVIAVFCLGAFLGVYFIGGLGERSIWICCALLLCVFSYLHWR